VLLTGAGFNASGWYPHVAALARQHPVYGVDMPGDPNPSIWRAPLTPPASCAAWLDELLARLGDRPAHLVGMSYGGWVAMNQAIRAPGRVMWAGSRGYRMEPKFPAILTDDELRAINVPALLITGARSAMLTPAEARGRGSLMPRAEVAVVPGSHGDFSRIDGLNDRIAAFIDAQAAGNQAGQPARPPTATREDGTVQAKTRPKEDD